MKWKIRKFSAFYYVSKCGDVLNVWNFFLKMVNIFAIDLKMKKIFY